MTDYTVQQSLNIPPSSRQDIISALLSEYGNSFEGSDGSPLSPYKMSPAPTLKELPPPPPQERARKNSNDKPLPPISQMSMRFQLRVDNPPSPNGLDGSRSSSENQPTKIVSRHLKRSSKPPSLTLTTSNGSTAALPPVPTLASQPTPSPRPVTTDKSLPPPPPEKSARRQQQTPPMGNNLSKMRPPRKDSLQSQDGKKDDVVGSDYTAKAAPVKRKPLFTSLADLKNGPRGGKGGPMPYMRSSKQKAEKSPKKDDGDRLATAIRNEGDNVLQAQTSPRPMNFNEQTTTKEISRIGAQLPPTPIEEPDAAPLPVRKPLAGKGLPSNPKHSRGKSSTGFDKLLNTAKSPRREQLPAPIVLTPGPTPTPTKTEQAQHNVAPERSSREVQRQGQSPTTSDGTSNQRRPFSFEPVPPQDQRPPIPAPNNVAPVAAPSSPERVFPPRSTSRIPPAYTNLPSQQRQQEPSEPPSESTSSLGSPSTTSPTTPTTPPFIPLTKQPASTVAPPIAEKHRNCYSRHATFIWSRNDFHPMPCMICKNNDRNRKWSCVWCQLRICAECSEELRNTPGKNLQAVIDKRGHDDSDGVANKNKEPVKGGTPTFMVWDADAEDSGDRTDFT